MNSHDIITEIENGYTGDSIMLKNQWGDKFLIVKRESADEISTEIRYGSQYAYNGKQIHGIGDDFLFVYLSRLIRENGFRIVEE